MFRALCCMGIAIRVAFRGSPLVIHQGYSPRADTCAERRTGIVVGGAHGGAYRAARGHITARYRSRHATWNVTCTLSGKVTVTASPCTGWVHQAQDRTGCACLRRGRLTFAILRPFLRSAVGTRSTHPHWERLLATPGACLRSLRSASGRPGTARGSVILRRRTYPSWWIGECSMKSRDVTENL